MRARALSRHGSADDGGGGGLQWHRSPDVCLQRFALHTVADVRWVAVSEANEFAGSARHAEGAVQAGVSQA